jgi:hypothetical protein
MIAIDSRHTSIIGPSMEECATMNIRTRTQALEWLGSKVCGIYYFLLQQFAKIATRLFCFLDSFIT